MAKIKGQSVILYEATQTGTDGFGAPIFTEEPVTVDNVLIGDPTTDDIVSSADLYGKKIVYMLGIPKGDTHNWQDKKISWQDAYGRTITVKSFGYPITGIEANIPLDWHMKVRCEAYGHGQG